MTTEEATTILSTKLTRRKFLKAVAAGTAWIVLANSLGCEPAGRRTPSKTMPVPSQYVRNFRSRPDFNPPAVEVATQARDTAPGYVFVAPKGGSGQDGPMIVDNRGEVVWFRPMHSEGTDAMNFKAQHYRGEPVLTWWQGRPGFGEYVILDSSYREIRRVSAGNGYQADMHEFLITPQDTALLTAFNPVLRDLSSVGGPRDGAVVDGIVQEVDIATGEVLFEWHSLDHVGLDESYFKLSMVPNKYFDYFFPTKKVFDYFHLNSIDIDHDSNLLVCARGTSTVYKIDRKSGEVIWRLGGKKSDFEMGPGTRFAYQHDARRQPDGTITIFDNGSLKLDEQSYGLVLELDEDEMTATLIRRHPHPDELLAATMGNMQVLPNGNVFIGWGSNPLFSESSGDGELLFTASFPPEVESYRAFRFPWSGYPSEAPAVVAESSPDDELTLYASWNGATEVASWQVLAGPTPKRLRPVGSAVSRDGFESAITVRTAEPYIGVQARARSGHVLGISKPIKRRN
jgi:hypothetical protein